MEPITINNKVITDRNLSLKAKGLYLELVYKYGNSTDKFKRADLIEMQKDAAGSLRTTLQELINNDYLYIKRQHDENGHLKASVMKLKG